jgi:hypothetical protein
MNASKHRLLRRCPLNLDRRASEATEIVVTQEQPFYAFTTVSLKVVLTRVHAIMVHSASSLAGRILLKISVSYDRYSWVEEACCVSPYSRKSFQFGLCNEGLQVFSCII